MPSILHDFVVHAPPERVYAAFATPAGLDAWWTLRSSGAPDVGTTYELFFGDAYDWRGRVVRAEPARGIEWEITTADADWLGTRVGAELTADGASTRVRFWHSGWTEASEHYRISSFCWAMYLRLLKRWVETGEVVAYERRLEV